MRKEHDSDCCCGELPEDALLHFSEKCLLKKMKLAREDVLASHRKEIQKFRDALKKVAKVGVHEWGAISAKEIAKKALEESK